MRMSHLHKITSVAMFWFAIPLIALGLVFASLPIGGDWKNVNWTETLYGIVFLIGGSLELKSAAWLWDSSRNGGVLGAVLSVIICLTLFLDQIFGQFEKEILALIVVNLLILFLIFAGWRQLS